MEIGLQTYSCLKIEQIHKSPLFNANQNFIYVNNLFAPVHHYTLCNCWCPTAGQIRRDVHRSTRFDLPHSLWRHTAASVAQSVWLLTAANVLLRGFGAVLRSNDLGGVRSWSTLYISPPKKRSKQPASCLRKVTLLSPRWKCLGGARGLRCDSPAVTDRSVSFKNMHRHYIGTKLFSVTYR